MKMRRSAKSSVLTGCLGRSAFYSNGKESLTRVPCASTTVRIGLLLVLVCAGAVQISLANTNRIKKENLRPGTTDWQLTNPADNRQIEGYASLTSVPHRGVIDLFVNTIDADYSLSVYRMGWYGGTGGRLVLGPITLQGVEQVTPGPDPVTGVISCEWVQPFRIKVPGSWLSGIYLVKLHGNTSGKESYIIFTVRDSRRAHIIFQQSVITYQAYNPWPGTYAFCCDGDSFYNADANGVQISQISFNRPYGGTAHQEFDTPAMFYDPAISPLLGIGAGDFFRNYGPTAMEFGMLRWLEHEGYDVTYITDVDTHEDIGRLLRGRAFLSVGHDEYWSPEMKSNVVQARDLGVSLGFFGGNYMFWAVELFPDSSGTPNRTIALVDPTKTCTFSCMGEPEQSVVGGNWVESVPTNGDIFVSADTPLDHWVFANTGLQVGDVIPGLIGIEYNATFPGSISPDGLQTLLHTQAPRFEQGIVEGLGGFPLPDTFNGDFDGWYDSWVSAGKPLDTTCNTSPIPPLDITPPPGWCRNPRPIDIFSDAQIDWGMTIYQVSSGALVFNAATNQWSWGLDDYFTGLTTADSANNGPPFRIQCGYPFFNPGLVSCRNPAIEQITRNVLNKFIHH
ncbi:MAG TPA: N,N-dimethylformamidase beta subunit family domain-containing protein [Terriglobales bacterium]|nr:N,N-dimethylformamidase beta subunit family domain-containing protein [Terriglobales bacterium]